MHSSKSTEMRKKKPPETRLTILKKLDHYGPKMAQKFNADITNSSEIIDYASSSESDNDEAELTGYNFECYESDESIENESNDPLRYAEVYTAEEVVRITRDKLIRLQSLYIDQFRILRHKLKECKRDYLTQVAQGNVGKDEGISANEKEPSTAQALNDKLKRRAINRYHYPHGEEAVLLHKTKVLKNLSVPSIKTSGKCSYIIGMLKCGGKTLPLSRYCFQHITYDTKQVLFKRCLFGGICNRPALVSRKMCPFHTLPIELQYRLPKKKEEQQETTEECVINMEDL